MKPDLRDAERLQGLPEDWTAPAAEVARPSLRWSLVGNAVTASVAEWIGRRLAEPRAHDPAHDAGPIRPGRRPRAARSTPEARVEVRVSAFPAFAPRPPLAAFPRHPGDPLSARAARGFLSRTARSGLRFVPGFLERVEAHRTRMEAENRLAAE